MYNKLYVGGRQNMPTPRPASGDTIYIIHASGSVTNSMSMLLACQYSKPKRPGDLDLWPFDLDSGVSVTCEVGYLCANFGLPMGLSVLDLGPMYATDRQIDVRQTDIRQHDRLVSRLGAGHNNSCLHTICDCLIRRTVNGRTANK